MIKYRVSYSKPLTRVIEMEVIFENVESAQLILKMPSWRPGRYEIQNFSKNVFKAEAFSEKNAKLPIAKTHKDTWVVQTGLKAGQKGNINIKYGYHAAQMDAGGSWLDEGQLYINWITCCMFVPERIGESCEVEVLVPKDYLIACGLPQEGNVLKAGSFYELVDAPMIASPTLKHQTYTVNRTKFHIWIQGDWTPDWPKLVAEFQAFTKEQLGVFKEFPFKEYHFLNHILPYRFFHGVEHANSTVIVLGPDSAMDNKETYKHFLGVSSHELFHAWNVIKIRPKEMMPYNLSAENHFTTGYVIEGVTTYYGDYMLARAGVITEADYFDDINLLLKRYYDNQGASNLSLADSSIDLWLDGYVPGVPGRKVSIYVKGALCALMLDLEIRKFTDNQKNLDHVMLLMWERYGKTGIGYASEEYIAAAEEVAGVSLQTYYQDYILGGKPIEKRLNQLLLHIGHKLEITASTQNSESFFGIRVAFQNNKCTVTAVSQEAAVYGLLTIDDEIIAVNQKRVNESNFDGFFKKGETVKLFVFRDNRLKEITAAPSQNLCFNQYHAKAHFERGVNQIENCNIWLGKQPGEEGDA